MNSQAICSESLYFDESVNRYRLQIYYYDNLGAKQRKSFTGKTKQVVREKRNKFSKKLLDNAITYTSSATIPQLLKELADYDYNINIIKATAYQRRIDTITIIEKSFLGNIPISDIQKNMINQYLFSLQSKYSNSTISKVQRRIDTITIIEKSFLGNIPISDIQKNMINQYLFSLQSKYSNSTISKVYAAISRAFKIAISRHIVASNPMDDPFLKRPKSAKSDRVIKAFTYEEEKCFLKALKDHKYNYGNNHNDYDSMLLIELFAGLRMGEIAALTPEDIDLNNNYIHVSKTVSRGLNNSVFISETPKTENGIRDVPVVPQLRTVLKKCIENYKDNKLNLIFYNHSMDRPITTQQVNDYFSRFCQKYCIKKNGGQHLLRHTYATRCIEAGIPAEVIMKWMGHSDISITINTYCDVFMKMHNDAVSLFTKYCDFDV